MLCNKEDAKTILRKLGIERNAYIIEGWFQQTVPLIRHNIGKIALLRIDADLYESTKYCLEELYNQVSPNGFIILDDYLKWGGSRKALYEFFNARNIYPPILFYPAYGGRAYFRKPS